MCGRASITKTEKAIEDRLAAIFLEEYLASEPLLPNYNVAPTHYLPVLTNEDPSHVRWMRWGLIPSWAKDHKIGYRMINARAETLPEKPAFRTALKKRRCLVAMDGFYEWKRSGKTKTPYRIKTTDQDIFCAAGLWEYWRSPDGQALHTFTVITTQPNELMKDIHDRMPVILSKDEERLWLDDSVPQAELLELLVLYPSEHMEAYEVDSRVGNVRNNDPQLIEPLP